MPVCYEMDLDAVLAGQDTRTTIMIKNIPNKYSQTMLLETFDRNHQGHYDFFYLPIDFKNKCNMGYAFLNFVHSIYIVDFFIEFDSQKWQVFNSDKICKIRYGRIQGKAALESNFSNMNVPTVQTDANSKQITKTRPLILDIDPLSEKQLGQLRKQIKPRLQKYKQNLRDKEQPQKHSGSHKKQHGGHQNAGAKSRHNSEQCSENEVSKQYYPSNKRESHLNRNNSDSQISHEKKGHQNKQYGKFKQRNENHAKTKGNQILPHHGSISAGNNSQDSGSCGYNSGNVYRPRQAHGYRNQGDSSIYYEVDQQHPKDRDGKPQYRKTNTQKSREDSDSVQYQVKRTHTLDSNHK